MSPAVARSIDRLMAYERTYFILIGVVHGLRNLGGSLLTALIYHREYQEDAARVTVTAVQLPTLWLFRRQYIEVPLSDNALYPFVGALTFLLTDAILYAQIEQDRYRRIFAGFLALSGLLLIGRSLS